ncbi:MAG: hypothetical protein OZ914_01390 [Anaerolineaceae bacterium]|jgi:hypothetical protein|nr:hypothetical protein [Anaerolineaceae bacterium]OQY89176.1 MAG: hypothetical protein B6D38_07445 [Anaerolineae bacterium UTCFX1]
MPEKKKPSDSEVFFLPPLRMILSFFDRENKSRRRSQEADEEQKRTEEKAITELIDKLSEQEDETNDRA